MKEQQIFTLTPENCPVIIGRSNNNNIVIDDDLLSRNHCTIDFSNGKWYIQDGYAKNGLKEEEIKRSTNGSWIYAFEDTLIYDKMSFKASHYLFECNLIDVSTPCGAYPIICSEYISPKISLGCLPFSTRTNNNIKFAKNPHLSYIHSAIDIPPEDSTPNKNKSPLFSASCFA